MFAYEPTAADEALLETYKKNANMRGMDCVPEPHLAGLQAVASHAEGLSREQAQRDAVLAEQVSPDVFLRIADHASVLAVLVQMAVKSGAIRSDAKVVLAGLDAALLAAGYSEKNAYTGWREMPERPIGFDSQNEAAPVLPIQKS